MHFPVADEDVLVACIDDHRLDDTGLNHAQVGTTRLEAVCDPVCDDDFPLVRAHYLHRSELLDVVAARHDPLIDPLVLA